MIRFFQIHWIEWRNFVRERAIIAWALIVKWAILSFHLTIGLILLAWKIIKKSINLIGRVYNFFASMPLFLLLLFTSAVFFFKYYDSFGLDQAADNTIAHVAASVIAPNYGQETGRIGQKSIALAMIDDATLAYFDQDGLPLSYSAQRQIFEEIAKAEPMAVFMDFYYRQPRRAIGKQNELLRLLGQKEISDPAVVKMADGFTALSNEYNVPLFIGEVGNDYALRPLLDFTQFDLQLPTANSLEYNIQRPNEELVPAAIGLYAFYCKRTPNEDVCRKHKATMADHSDQKMFIQWGFGVSERQKKLLPSDERKRCSLSPSYFVSMVHIFGIGLMRSNGAAGRRNESDLGAYCTYHDAVSIAQYLESGGAKGPLAGMLKGRIVFIGVDSAELGDRWQAPLYEQVSGVAVHAMAFDNLIEYGGQPPILPKPIGGLGMPDFLQIATMLAVMGLIFGLRKKTRYRLLPDGSFILSNSWTGAIILLSLTTCGLMYAVTIWVNWPLPLVLTTILAPSGLTAICILMLSRKPKQLQPERYTGDV